MLQVLFRQHSTMTVGPQRRHSIEKQSSMITALFPHFPLTWWSMLGSSWFGAEMLTSHSYPIFFAQSIFKTVVFDNNSKETDKHDDLTIIVNINCTFREHFVVQHVGFFFFPFVFDLAERHFIHVLDSYVSFVCFQVVALKNTEWQFRCELESVFWFQRHLDESKRDSESQWIRLLRPNKPVLAVLFHSALIYMYTVTHMGIKALKWVSQWFFFALHSNSIQIQM